LTYRPVRIITDSTADLPSDIVERLGILTIPISINFGTTTYLHGVDIDSRTFYQMLARREAFPTTSAPPPAWFEQVYAEQLDAGYDIVSVHLASTLSSMFDGAASAARRLHSDRIAVIDSGQLTMGLGLLVQVCAQEANAGAGLEAVSELARQSAPRLRLAGILDTLDYVHRGGRISATQAMIGSWLRIHPLFEVEQGDVRPAGYARTARKAVSHLVKLVAGWGPLKTFTMIHANNPDLCRELEQHLTSRLATHPAGRVEAGPAVVTHVGPGAVGVAGITLQS
jgi:DegV family protein with EDD domain